MIVRTYDDQNDNQVYDPGEEVEKVHVVKFFIDKEKIEDYSYETDKAGQVTLTGISKGPIGFIVDPPYEFSSADNKLYYEASVDTGPRFFSQVVDIPVRKRARPVAGLSPQAAPPNTNVAQEINQSDAPTDENSSSVNFTLHGHIFTLDEEGAPQGWKAPWYIDLDGNEIRLKGKEPLLTLNPHGRYEIIVPIEEINDETVLRPLILPDDYEDPGGIALSLDDIRDGELIIATEMKRKPISYQGMLSVEPEGELPEGFVIYVDKNQNAQRDEGETHMKIGATGEFEIEEEWFEDYAKPTILRVEAPEKYEIPVPTGRGKQNINLPVITFNDANFKTAKKKNVINDPTDESQAEEEIVSIPDFKEDPEQYLTYLGYHPLLDDNKTWRLYDPDAAIGFTKAKAAYVKARKQKKWDARLQDLSAVINARQVEADRYGVDAGKKSKKGPQAKAEAKAKQTAILTQIGKWQEEQGKIQAEKERFLSDIRDNLSTLTSNSQNYQRVEADENCEKAAQAAGIELMSVPDKHKKTWETANRFDAELALEEKFGLTAIGKVKNKTWSLQSLATIKSKEQQFNQIYTQFRASGYLQLKQQQDKLTEELKFDEPEYQQVKSKLQQMERNPKFKQGITQLKTKAKSFFDALNQVIGQSALVREHEDQIKTYFERTGGNYETFINTLPDEEELNKQLRVVQEALDKLPS